MESQHRCRVLVIDDDADVRESTAMVIRMLGHDVVTAGDGLAGMEQGRLLEPQLVLLDVGLPGADGHEVARQMRAESWGQRALLAAMTGWVDDAAKAQSTAAGFDLHLCKPVTLTTLRDVLTQASSASQSGHDDIQS